MNRFLRHSPVYKYILTAFFIIVSQISWAGSVTLMNNSTYTLQAVVYDSTGKLLGQFVVNPGEATQWSDNFENFNFGMENSYQSVPPYTVNWFCMSGNPFGSCTYVAAGAVVTSQSCGGNQECREQQQNYYP